MPHDVFISYSTHDKALADAACATLERRGVRCWIAPRDIPPSVPYALSLMEAIHACRVMLLVFSSHSLKSKDVATEVFQAFQKGIPVLPWRIEDVQPTGEMQYYLGRVHWLDAVTPPIEAHLDRLADRVADLLTSLDSPEDATQPVQPPTTGAPLAAPARKRARRRVMRAAMAVALVALSGAGWLLWLAHNPAAVKGVAMTDHPLPATTSREAVAHYGSALSKLRLGTMGSRTEFEKAVALDPTLAAAQLRLALYGFWFGIPAAERRLHLAQASVFAASLEPREKALLPVAEAVASDPIETDIAIARTRAVEERYPEDAEVALYFYILVQSSKPAAEVEAAALRALALDPLETQVLAIQTDDALKDNQLSKASALVDRCLQLAPGAAGCRYRRAVLESEEGRCEALLTDARESVRTQPDVSSSYGLLALALAATHAPAESVGSALEDAESQRVANAHEPGGLARLAFATFTGDLAGADAVAAALMPTVAAAHSERLNGLLALHRIELAEETGGSAKALSIAETFARQASAWTQDGPMGVRAKRLYLLREAGTLDEAAFAAARDTLIDEILKEGDAGGASPWLVVFFPELPSGATGDPTARDAIRLMLDASYAETPAEANAALTTEAQRTLMTRYLSRRAPQLDAWVVGFGHLLALAGRTDDAVPLLERMTRSCEVVGPDVSLADLGASLTYLKAQGFLGEALEAKGDRTGACQAYGVIQARWKDPRPRSVTWEKATARARVLGCPAPTGG